MELEACLIKQKTGLNEYEFNPVFCFIIQASHSLNFISVNFLQF